MGARPIGGHLYSRHRLSFAVVMAAVFAVSFFVFGQVGGPSGIRVPYQGRLELNGVAVDDDEVSFRFTLHTASQSPCGSPLVATAPVRGGSFAVEIGPLPSACIIGQEVDLTIEVDADGTGYVALAGTQRLLPAAAAATTGPGDFGVERTIAFKQAPGDETNAGKIGYRAFSSSLDIVGAGTSYPRSVQIHDRLLVNDSISAGSISGSTTHLPAYDSGWFAVYSNSNNTITLSHFLGAPPRLIQIDQAAAPDQGPIVSAGSRGYQDGAAAVNPVTVTKDANYIRISVLGGWWTWAYWDSSVGWTCAPDDNCMDGWYRVYAWR